MKLLLFLLLLGSSIDITAQKTIFVRVYDFHGNKIGKGNVYAATDSSLQLGKDSATKTFAVSKIGSIKTKRSAGNNILIGSIVGGTSLAIAGAASADPEDEILGYTAGEGAAAGLVTGAVVGAAVGGITILFKNSKTFLINGDATNWKTFQSFVTIKKE
jgi:hypothetical protein